MAKVKIDIVGDASSAQKAFRDAGNAAKGYGSKLGMLVKGGLIAGAAAASYGLARGLKSSVQAAMEAEQVQASLAAQLKAAGISYDKTRGQIDKTVESLSRLSGLDDEDLTSAFTRLVRSTQDVAKAQEQMGLVADFARARNVDAAKAAEVIGKVLDGNTGILKRYGVEVEKGATVTEALGVAQQKFAGQAKAYGDTAAGAQDKLRVSLQNVQETIGAKLLPAFNSMLVWATSQMPKVSAFFNQHAGTIRAVLATIQGFIRNFVIPTFESFRTIASSAIAGVRRVVDENGPQIRNIMNAVKTVVEGLGKAWLWLAQNVVIPVLKPVLSSVLPAAFGVALKAISSVVSVTTKLIEGWKWVGANGLVIWKMLGNGIKGATAGITDALAPISSVIWAIDRAMASVIGMVDDFLNAVRKIKSAAGAVGGIAGKIIPDLPGRAAGGPVTAGQPYVVGEKGPELFVPGASGRIVPNDGTSRGMSAAGGGGTVIINVPNYVGDRLEFVDWVHNALLQKQRRVGSLGIV